MTEKYKKEYEDAKAAIEAGNIKGAIACDRLLTDTELPRYYRIKTLVSLASASKGWRTKEDLRLRAEHTWSESRTLYPAGQNDTTDSVLSELRSSLDTLRISQAESAPLQTYEDELSAALAETEIEDLADIAEGQLEDLADEEYARDQQITDESPLAPTTHTNSTIASGVNEDEDATEVKLPSPSPNSSFAPASSLEASKEILGQVRDGQTAGSRMVHRTRGVGRRLSQKSILSLDKRLV